MEIRQFQDKNLAHYSYAIVSCGAMAVIDPARDPQPYYDFAGEKEAKLVAVIETHPHADFISSHLEIHQTTGATVYASKLLDGSYPHTVFDEGQMIRLGEVKLKALNTPGHSPDSISIILENERGQDEAAFTGDTLFIGDCGRPDLRENAGNVQQKREDLAGQMYDSLKKFLSLPDEVTIYPAHGAGSLCGRALSDKNSSTLGEEKAGNWCLQPMNRNDFVIALTEAQPFIPKYFTYDVELNRKGAPPFLKSINKVKTGDPVIRMNATEVLDPEVLLIDTRSQKQFNKGHLNHSINIPDGIKFETWLGSVITPGERFYLASEDSQVLKLLIARVAKIGYEPFIEKAFVLKYGNIQERQIDLQHFREHPRDYVILDVRNEKEAGNEKFRRSLHIPLDQLRDRINEIPLQKPVVVHCSGGYRSAIATSILKNRLENAVQVYDLGEAIKEF